jgi:trigger factor
LISDKIIQDNNLQVSPEELKEGMRADFMRYLGGMSLGGDMSWMDAYLERAMKDEKQVENTYRRMVIEKLFAWAEQQVKPTEKAVSAEELQAMQHNHSH